MCIKPCMCCTVTQSGACHADTDSWQMVVVDNLSVYLMFIGPVRLENVSTPIAALLPIPQPLAVTSLIVTEF